MNHANLVTEALQTVLSGATEPGLVERYFAPSYTQLVDGKQLDYTSFVRHLATLHQRVESLDLRIDQLIAQDDKVVSVHYVTVKKSDATQTFYKVIAVFTIQAGRIVRCEELTRLEQGDNVDRDLGSC
ncbi:nuclear transport factor 2 family protein [Paludibacterium purpuratum]|uniref:SnoaL-like protein n=1 Tax=Paludibacterium purpuratum TaxID=1144873 RepID=A0A4R7B139_9NEIS|nr:nuclear transport factor 2 family protein [Paludibacterium purpuratum]TDR72978.1 SnoaL-like protein [Paludibacterium purpuratum]